MKFLAGYLAGAVALTVVQMIHESGDGLGRMALALAASVAIYLAASLLTDRFAA